MTSHLDIYGMLTCKLFFLDRMTLVCIFKEAVLEFVHFLYVSRIKSSTLINQKSISFFHKWVNIIKLHFQSAVVHIFGAWRGITLFSSLMLMTSIYISELTLFFSRWTSLFKLQIIVLVPAISANPDKSCSGEITASQRHCMGCLNKKPSSLKTKESRQYYIFDFQ